MAYSGYSPVSPNIDGPPTLAPNFREHAREYSQSSITDDHVAFNRSYQLYDSVAMEYTRNGDYATRFQEDLTSARESRDVEFVGAHADSRLCNISTPAVSRESQENDANTFVDDRILVEKGPAVPAKDYRFFLVIGGMCLAWFTRGLDDTIVSTINTELSEQFNDLSDIAWYGSAYLFPQATLTMFFGKLSTEVNLTHSWILSTATFMAGSVVCAMAKTSVVFILGRALTGIAVSAIGPTGLTMLTHITTADERPGYIALIIGVETLSLSLGPITGALLTEKANYRWCFIVALPLAVVSCAMVALCFKEPRRVPRQQSWRETIAFFDPLGCALVIISTLLLVLGLQFAAESSDWNSAKVIVTISLSGVALLALLVQQWLCEPEYAFIPRPILNRGVAMALAFGFVVVFTNHILSFYLPFYLQAVRNQSVIKTSILLLPFLMVAGFCSLATGYGLSLSRYPNPFMYTSGIFLVLGSILISRFDINTAISLALGAEAIAGIGSGIGQVLGISSVELHVPTEYKSFTLSMALTAQLLGATMGVAIGGNLLNTQIMSRIKSSTLSVMEKTQVMANTSDKQVLIRLLSEKTLATVVRIFASSVQSVFLVGLGGAVVALIVTIHIKWTPKRDAR